MVTHRAVLGVALSVGLIALLVSWRQAAAKGADPGAETDDAPLQHFVRGTVVDTEGAAVPLAEVTTVRWRAGKDEEPGSCEIGQTVRASSKGVFEFAYPESGMCALRAQAPGLVGHSISYQGVANRVVVTETGDLKGMVVNSQGQPIQDATLVVVLHQNRMREDGAAPVAVARSDREGRFAIANLEARKGCGRYILRACKAGYAPTTIDNVDSGAMLKVVLNTGGSIEGTLQIEAHPAAGITVLACRSGTPLMNPRRTVTDQKGHYRLESLEPGSYGLRVESERYCGEGQTHVTEGASAQANLILGLGGKLQVAALDSDTGKGIAGVKFSLWKKAPRPASEDDSQWRLRPVLPPTDADGRSTLTGLSPGAYGIQIESAGGYLASSQAHGRLIDVASNQTTASEFRLTRGATADIVVTDQSGSPVPGARLMASYISDHPVNASPGLLRPTETQPGRYRLVGLPRASSCCSSKRRVCCCMTNRGWLRDR